MLFSADSEEYKQLLNILKYKIAISNKIKWYTNCIEHNRYIDIDELYHCHENVLRKDKLYPRYNKRDSSINDPSMDFTIHHCIYYFVRIQSNAFKMISSINDEYDILEIFQEIISVGRKIHLDKLIYNIYDYLYPTTDFYKISTIFISLKNIDFIINLDIHHDLDVKFTNWDEYDLLNELNYYIESFNDDVDYDYNKMNDTLNHVNDCIILITEFNQKKASENLKIYEEELMVKTWHPDRLIDWCFDVDDKKDIGITS